MERFLRYVSIFIVVHGLVSLLHEISHRILPVGLAFFDYAAAYAFVGFLPLIALGLLWSSYRRAGAWLLLISMAGSLIDAGVHHFVWINPDHVLHAPQGRWLPTFQATAVLMLILEAYGSWLGFRLIRLLRQNGGHDELRRA